MNEKTTQSDMDLKIRKMEFLEKMGAFAKRAKNKLMEKHSEKDFDECLGIFKSTEIRIYKCGGYVVLRWNIKNVGLDFPVTIFSNGVVEIEHRFQPFQFLEEFLRVPFEEYEGAFDRALHNLSKGEQKISIDVTQEQLDKIKEHKII